MNVPFLNLAAQHAGIAREISAAVEGVLDSAHYILGPNVTELEKEIAAFTNTNFGIGVNSGSDALTLASRALEIGSGDEVITSPFTYIAPAESIYQVGAKIVFADIDERTFLIDPAAIENKISARTKAIIPIHLFGQAAPMEKILALAQPRGISIVEDCAQAIGARQNGTSVGSFGAMGCFSFYPTKNLGANGDGGMVVTKEDALAKKLRMLRVHGIEKRYYHDLHGFNSRLDEIQAAILRVKLKRLNEWNARRTEIAGRYSDAFANLPVQLPMIAEGNTHVYHVYALLCDRRNELQQFLAENGVPVLIYYPLALHLQKVYADMNFKRGDFPVAEKTSERILPLPMYPELTEEQVDYVIATVKRFFAVGQGARTP